MAYSKQTPTASKTNPSFAAILHRALTEPGLIHSAYTTFHGYSISNQMLAWIQCEARGLQVGPIASFKAWQKLGRHVVKGQKAIELCMPVTSKFTRTKNDPITGVEQTEECRFNRFIFRPNWFVLSQTDGAEYVPVQLPAWDKATALTALNVTEIPFDHIDGNVQGFARGTSVSVSPIAALPEKTLFHELAHVVLGHTASRDVSDAADTPRTIQEVQAEGVACLVSSALGLPGFEYSAGYIQHWQAAGGEITDQHAQQIFKAANTILKAGRVETTPAEAEV